MQPDAPTSTITPEPGDGLAQSSSGGGFRSSDVLVPGLAGVGLLAAFVWHALRASHPLIDLRLFTNRTFAPRPPR